ncbi:hypothetical protein WMY93_029831 [Mugilogobius chulae]|uniref:Uncharacterized protein n=1 Tax=Mugilogobius chulae TaxID=88201 RepID=A0AAW0MQK2_9GOBI
MHFNENTRRPQATKSKGELMYRVFYPKYRQGEGIARPIKEKATFQYVDDILELVFEEVFHDPASYVQEMQMIPIPPPLSTEHSRPDKETVVAGFVSRFNPAPV